jgi:hypothetical protein
VDTSLRPASLLTCMSTTILNAIATVSLVSCIACTGPKDRIKPGMPEADVLRLLGSASRTTSDAVEMDRFLRASPECRSQAKRALIYDYWLADDVVVAVGQEGRVKCVGSTEIIDKITE